MKKFNEYVNEGIVDSVLKFFKKEEPKSNLDIVLLDDNDEYLELTISDLGKIEDEFFYKVEYSSNKEDFPSKKYDLISLEQKDYSKEFSTLSQHIEGLNKKLDNNSIDLKDYPSLLLSAFKTDSIDVMINYYNKRITVKWEDGIESVNETSAGKLNNDSNNPKTNTVLTPVNIQSFNPQGSPATGSGSWSSGQNSNTTNTTSTSNTPTNNDIEIILKYFSIFNTSVQTKTNPYTKTPIINCDMLCIDNNDLLYKNSAIILGIKENSNDVDLTSPITFKTNHNYNIHILIDNQEFKFKGIFSTYVIEVSNIKYNMIQIDKVDRNMGNNYVEVNDKKIKLDNCTEIKNFTNNNSGGGTVITTYSVKPPNGKTFNINLSSPKNKTSLSLYEFHIKGNTGTYQLAQTFEYTNIGNPQKDLTGFEPITIPSTNNKFIKNDGIGEIKNISGNNWEIIKYAKIKFSDSVSESLQYDNFPKFGEYNNSNEGFKNIVKNIFNKTKEYIKPTKGFDISKYPMNQNYLVKVAIKDEYEDFIIRKILLTEDNRVLCRLLAMNNCKFIDSNLESKDIDGKNFLISFKNVNVKIGESVRMIRIFERSCIYKLKIGFLSNVKGTPTVKKNYIQNNINLLSLINEKSVNNFIDLYNICIENLKRAKDADKDSVDFID